MKRNDVAKAVVMTTNRGANEYVKSVVKKSRGRFLFAFWFDPRKATSLPSLQRDNERTKVALVKIHPSHVKTRLDDKKMAPVLDFCEANRLPILVHCGRWLEMSGFEIALDVAQRHPELNLLLAHMGGVTRQLRLKTIKETERRRLGNVYLVTSGPISIKPGEDLLYAPETCPPDIVQAAVMALGSKRVVFGSDFPFGLQDQILKCIELAEIRNKEYDDIVFGNAARLFRLAS